MKQFLIKAMLLMAACLILSAEFAVAEPDFEITFHSQVARKRLSRTVYKITYKALIENRGTDALNVTAQLSIDSEHVTVIDGSADFGDVPADTTAINTDTFTIQWDRRYPIESNDISWSISHDPPALPQVTFGTDPLTVNQGDMAILSWTTVNADTVTIDQGIGTVAINGSIAVTPAATTTYTLTASGPGGSQSAQLTVTVREMTTRTRYEYDALGRIKKITRYRQSNQEPEVQ